MQPRAADADTALTGAALREAKRALRAPSFATARCVLVTFPFASEWDTRPLALAALKSGKTLVVPRVNNASRMLELHVVADIERDVTPGYRGIPEPLPTLPQIAAAAIDWVLVPGVAFGPEGSRLGYGGGYYDRLMITLQPGAARIAGAFEAQIVAHIPAASHDLRVDLIVTESRILMASAQG